MTKRWLAAALWFYAGWWIGNFISDFAGVSLLLGPAIGATLAVLIAGDPLHRIWPQSAAANQPLRQASAEGI